MKKVMKDIFLRLVFNVLKNYTNFIKIYHFHLRRCRLEKLEVNLHDETEFIIHIRNLN